MKIFHARAALTEKTGHCMYPCGRFECENPPTEAEYRARFEEDARKGLAERGFPDAGPLKMTYFTVVELPPMPKPAAKGRRRLARWKIEANIVCHDLRFSGYVRGVFAWPEEPAGLDLSQMIGFLIAEDLARRGEDLGYGNYTEVNSQKVEPTDELAINL